MEKYCGFLNFKRFLDFLWMVIDNIINWRGGGVGEGGSGIDNALMTGGHSRDPP